MSKAEELVKWLINKGIEGSILPSAKDLASHYLEINNNNPEEAIDDLIKWKTRQATGTGFLTGLGGFAALPVQIPSSVASCYLISANTIAGIAELKGYDTDNDKVKTLILLCMIGEGRKEILKQAGVQTGKKLTEKVLQQVPGKVFIEINKKVGFRLLTKAGEKGIVNFIKLVPLAGGVVGATIDSKFVKNTGKIAKREL